MDNQFTTGDTDRDHSAKDFTPHSRCRSHGLLDCFVCKDSNPLFNGINDQPALRNDPVEYKCKPPTKDEINRVLNQQRKGVEPICCRIDPKEYTDWGNNLLKDSDACWEAIGKVFPQHATIDSNSIIQLLSEKTGKEVTLDRSEEYKEKTVHVEGIPTKIKYDDLVAAYKALSKIGTPKMAEKIVAQIVAKRIMQLF